MIRRHVLSLLLALGACNHQNCGDNAAERYAHFLDPRADCLHHWLMGEVQEGDYTLCDVNHSQETWLCSSSQCRPLGAPIVMERKR